MDTRAVMDVFQKRKSLTLLGFDLGSSRMYPFQYTDYNTPAFHFSIILIISEFLILKVSSPTLSRRAPPAEKQPTRFLSLRCFTTVSSLTFTFTPRKSIL